MQPGTGRPVEAERRDRQHFDKEKNVELWRAAGSVDRDLKPLRRSARELDEIVADVPQLAVEITAVE